LRWGAGGNSFGCGACADEVRKRSGAAVFKGLFQCLLYSDRKPGALLLLIGKII
jgi:hypothetical protein